MIYNFKDIAREYLEEKYSNDKNILSEHTTNHLIDELAGMCEWLTKSHYIISKDEVEQECDLIKKEWGNSTYQFGRITEIVNLFDTDKISFDDINHDNNRSNIPKPNKAIVLAYQAGRESVINADWNLPDTRPFKAECLVIYNTGYSYEFIKAHTRNGNWYCDDDEFEERTDQEFQSQNILAWSFVS